MRLQEVNALMLLITLNHMAVFCQTEHGFVLAGKAYARYKHIEALQNSKAATEPKPFLGHL